jgi:integrase
MFDMVLTPDNTLLKGYNNERQSQPCAVNCTTPATSAQSVEFAINCTNEDCVRDLIGHSVSDNTRIAYKSDLKHFTAWGGILPATPAMIASYIAAYAGVLAVATITRRVATLSKAHQAMGEENPCQAALVKATLRGLRRKQGTAQKQAKPLLKDDLFAVLEGMGDSLKDVRDRALLLLGFAGGFRRSELVGLDVTDIEMVRQGIIITLRHSKTDQEGAGRKIGIPHRRPPALPRCCPHGVAGAF